MAMEIDPFSMLEVSLQEEPEEDRRQGSSGIMHQVENDVRVVQPPPPLHLMGDDVITPQRAVLNNVHKLALTTKEEEKFRRRAYSSISLVLRKRLHCTICDAHIGAYLGLKEMDIEHPLLKVLACSKCTLKYHYLEFQLNLDGRDIRCRWCTESAKEESPLRYCNYCPFAFCEMCIYRNLPLDELASNKNNWMCFVCNIEDLWPSRAVLWALRVLIDTNLALKEEKKWSTDQSTCCKNKTTKQRRPVALPPTAVAQNGHQPPPLRPIAPARPGMVNPIRSGRPVVRPILPITPTRALPMSSQNSTTQLYDTAWLTEKVQSISTTLLNLNNNLHRIAQGIPEKENKYSIKSKMISMVSLLNISATQLQKASKEMEEESKKILDKNYKVAKVTPVSVPAPVVVAPEPVKVEHKIVLKPIVLEKPAPKNTAKRRRLSATGKGKRFKGSSEFDSEYEEDEEEDFDDPDFLTKSLTAGEGPRTRLRTRACFVKLERLDESFVDDMKTESNDGHEPRPSTSKAPDPMGTVGPEDLRASGNGEQGGTSKEEGKLKTAAGADAVPPAAEVTDGAVRPADDASKPAAKESSVGDAAENVEAASKSTAEKPSTSDANGDGRLPAETSQPLAENAQSPQTGSQPVADDDSRSSAAPDPKPVAESSGLGETSASTPSSKPPESNPPVDDERNDAPGEDPLNESSATESSITDSSSASVDTSDV